MEKEDTKLLSGRIRELDRTAFQRDILRHTDFLSLSEQAVYHRLEGELSCGRRLLLGGHPEADRAVLFFLPSYMELPGAAMSEGAVQRTEGGLLGAAEKARAAAQAAQDAVAQDAIACLRVEAAHEKFAEPLTHRDYLGALMNLGISREKTGDILTDGTGRHAFLFCMRELSDYICGALTRVRHTSVRCTLSDFGDCDIVPAFEELRVNVASERLDAVIAAVWKLSRSEAAALVAQEAVFADGRAVQQPGALLREGARVSVRGQGKFVYEGMEHTTKKGRLYVAVRRFV